MNMPGSSVSESHRGGSLIVPARRLPIGAEYLGDGRTHFRVWAPAAERIDVVGRSETPLAKEHHGYHSGVVDASPGERYRFRIDGGEALYPDPASRFQPDGPHDASEIVDPSAFPWTDASWRGATPNAQVMYEMHVGTFTRAGTWAAAIPELGELARIGITTVELMPVADFNGRFGWGYDGVNLFAPTRLYGRPDDFRAFVDAAHAAGLAVILDVVYNHFGPVGNYLRFFAPEYFTKRYENEWGEAINFDGPDAAPVREYFIANAGYWIDEFHVDGLRLDATQQIYDASSDHILAAIGRRAREAARHRTVLLVAENEPQDTRLVRAPGEGGYGLDALWNDDFHHSAMVSLTGRAEAYYSDTTGHPQELISAAKYGYLFQGQPYHWQRKRRGTPAWGLPPAAFVNFLQNHDQVANSARGLRGHQLTSPGRWRAMTALLLLMPATPMLFQGQEFSASSPFLYFADLDPEVGAMVRKGRAEFLTQFPSLADYAGKSELDDPTSRATFERSVLDLGERTTHAAAYALHQDLLRLRRENVAFRKQRAGGVDGAVLSNHAFALRFFTDDHLDDRLLLVNLGPDLSRLSFAEPLLAPPAPTLDWVVEWSSEDPAYGGGGVTPFWTVDHVDHGAADQAAGTRYLLPSESALVLGPSQRTDAPETGIRRRSA
jgi:maltooligosyltrehalose trehalohydrolase